LEIHTKALCVSLWLVSVFGFLCVSVCLLLWLASVVGFFKELCLKLWSVGAFCIFFLAEKIQRFFKGLFSFERELQTWWLLDCSSGGKEEEELVFGFLLLLLVRELLLSQILFVAVEIARGSTRPEQRLLSLLPQQLCIF
jgi:hypothetical protein